MSHLWTSSDIQWHRIKSENKLVHWEPYCEILWHWLRLTTSRDEPVTSHYLLWRTCDIFLFTVTNMWHLFIPRDEPVTYFYLPWRTCDTFWTLVTFYDISLSPVTNVWHIFIYRDESVTYFSPPWRTCDLFFFWIAKHFGWAVSSPGSRDRQ